MINSPKIQSIVQDFISQLSAALGEEGASAIKAALGGMSEAAAPELGGRRPGRPPKAAAAAAPAAPKRVGRGKGAKRTPEELESQTKALLAHIKKNPGERIEAIGKAIGIPTKDLALPVAKLLESKAISKKGQRRATTYFPK